MTAYVVKINDHVTSKVFECQDDACLYVENKGFKFLCEDEYKFEFFNSDDTSVAVVIKCNFIKKKISPFKVGDKIEFKRAAIDSGYFANFVKVGNSCFIESIEGDTAYLRMGGSPQYQIVKMPDLTEKWFEKVTE